MKGYSIALLIGLLAGPLGVIGQSDVNFQGTSRTTRFGDFILEFRGIRYAEPPVGELRFKAPVAVNITAGTTVNATADGPMCPQAGANSSLISEDCLFLNVFTKNMSGSAPVMVYIHGGGNVAGSGHSSFEAAPDYLLRHDVVLVAFNYRLGALGFLSTRSEEAPGNFGFLDQVMALQWVQTHILRFGGDPKSVTIFGMSAGAMAVTLHMASPLSAGLFHRAIAMSGSATNHYNNDNLEYTRKLAREVSCPLYTPKHVVDCLRNVTWERIVEVCAEWQNQSFNFVNMKWNYEIDGHFLTDHPTDVFRLGKFHKVPLIAGITKDEFDFSVYVAENDTTLLNDISENFDLYAPELFHFNVSEPAERKYKGNRIKSFYLGNRTDIAADNLQDFGKIFSDAFIGHGVHRLVDLASRYVHVFYYRFDYQSNFSNFVNHKGEPLGVCHADDLQYLMPSEWKGPDYNNQSDSDRFMIERMTDWFTSFAKLGAPHRPNDTLWDSVDFNNITALYNDKEAKMGEPPYADRYKLWDELFPVSKDSGAPNLSLSWLLFSATAVLAGVFRL